MSWLRILLVSIFFVQQSALGLSVEIELSMNVRQVLRPGEIDMSAPIGRLKKGTVIEIPDDFLVHDRNHRVLLRESIQKWVSNGRDGAGLYNMSNHHRDYFLPVYLAEEAARARRENRPPHSQGLVALNFLARHAHRLIVRKGAYIYPVPITDAHSETMQAHFCAVCELDSRQTATWAQELAARMSSQQNESGSGSHFASVPHFAPIDPDLPNVIVTSPFGRRHGEMHKGLDIAAPQGTPVRASANGKVELIGYDPSGWGHYIVLSHADGYKTRYAHLKPGSIGVKVGSTIKVGQNIAKVGHSGNAHSEHPDAHHDGSHLHYEVLLDGRPVNPEDGHLQANYRHQASSVKVATNNY